MTAASRARVINHITVHDGFTLADLFSYNQKHNEANGEDNRDGSNDNHSNNCGHEGPSDDPAIVALRRQLRKNQLACLLLAQGLPLILAGDEVGNSQSGNNNAYCQDNRDRLGRLGTFRPRGRRPHRFRRPHDILAPTNSRKSVAIAGSTGGVRTAPTACCGSHPPRKT